MCCFSWADQEQNKWETYFSHGLESQAQYVCQGVQFFMLPSRWPDLPAHPPTLEGNKEVLVVLCKGFQFFSVTKLGSWLISNSLSYVVALCSFVNIGKS